MIQRDCRLVEANSGGHRRLSADPPATTAADRTEIATELLEFGGSVGKLLWVTVESRAKVGDNEANQYRKLSYQVRGQIDGGRAI